METHINVTLASKPLDYARMSATRARAEQPAERRRSTERAKGNNMENKQATSKYVMK